MKNRSQAIRLPKDFQFNTSEVFIRRQGNDVILSARPTDWSANLVSGPVASTEFMNGIGDLPAQEREISGPVQWSNLCAHQLPSFP